MTPPSKDEVMRHFDEFSELVEILRDRGKDKQAAKVQRAAEIIHPVAVTQEKPLGLGHAVGLAESVLDEDEDCFAVMLPDDVIEPTVAMSEMIRVRQNTADRFSWQRKWILRMYQITACSILSTPKMIELRRSWAWCKSLRLRIRRRFAHFRGASRPRRGP